MTVVTREAEWDEMSVSRAMELHRHEANQCRCGCGQPMDVASDDKRAFRIQTHTCYAKRALDRFEAEQVEKAKRESRPDGWDNGLTYYIDDSFVPEPKGGVKRG